jgi:hypothetical protein
MSRSPLVSSRVLTAPVGSPRSAFGPRKFANAKFAKFGYKFTRFVVSAVLLTAAALKTAALVTGASLASTNVISGRWAQIALIEVELLLAILLLVGTRPRLTCAAALVLFTIFALVSLTKLASGAETCGCFGAAPIHPGYSFALDIAIIALLYAFPPIKGRELASGEWRAESGEPDGKVHQPASLLWLPPQFYLSFAILPLAAAALSLYQPTVSSAKPGVEIVDGRLVIVDPVDWVGTEFPLLDYTDIGDQLGTGNWAVLVYHHDCQDCRTALGELAMSSPNSGSPLSPLRSPSAQTRIAVIEIPPYGSSPAAPGSVVHGRVTDELEWFVATPLWLELTDGRVTGGRSRHKNLESHSVNSNSAESVLQTNSQHLALRAP